MISMRKVAQCDCRHNYLLSTFVAVVLILLVAAVLYSHTYSVDSVNLDEPDNRRYKAMNDMKNKVESFERNLPEPCERYPPKAIVIGVRKCGTGPLAMFFRAHPDIDNVPTKGIKSISFFDVHYTSGVNWYISQMPCSKPDHATVDQSISYFMHKRVPERIYMFNSTIKLILLVREPISRTISQYLQSKDKPRVTDPDLESFVLDKSRRNIDTGNFAVSESSYYDHLRNWLQFFPLSQFLFIDTMELVKEPIKPLRKLESFLGVRSYFNSDTVYFNKTRGFHCIKMSYRGKNVCANSNKGREHPQLTSTTHNLLKEYFDPLNENFFKTVGKQFNWTTVKREPTLSVI